VTRTGLITSVHAFEKRQTLVYILSTFVIVVAVVSVALIAARWRRFGGQAELESLLSRDLMHHVTNVALSLFAGTILFATVVVPLVTSNGRSVGPQTFNAFAQPLGVVVLLGIALCQLLSWRRTEGGKLRRALRWPALAAVLSIPLFAFTGDWTASIGGFVALVACVFAGVAVIESMIVRARTMARDTGILTGLWRALTSSRTRTAGFVAHVGMVLVVLGLLGSNVYKVESHAFIAAKPGSQAGIGAYTLRFTGMHVGSGPQGSERTYAAFAVFKNGSRVATLQPRTDVYPSMQQAVRAVILGSAGQDLFVAPNAPFTSTSTQISLQLDVFPLVRLVWAGALLLVAGAAVSLWLRPRRAAEPVAGQA
jgi:cytochrome c-type biogenesis protein CcmF